MENQGMNPGSCPSKKSGPNPRKPALQRVLPSLGSLGKGSKQLMERTPKWGVGWGGPGNPCQRCPWRAERLSSTVRRWEPALGRERTRGEPLWREVCDPIKDDLRGRRGGEVSARLGGFGLWRALPNTAWKELVRKFGGGEGVGRVCNQTMSYRMQNWDGEKDIWS